MRINRGYGVFAEHHFVEVNRRWFAGGQASLQEYKIERDDADGSAKYTNALLMAFGGYAIQPFNFNLYFKPWAGVGYTGKISGQTKLGDAAYHIAPITMFATLHVGYSF
ncbi:MAG: hypothetical protein IPI11_04750 [Haliscomenobacter sp.]|nr:hypothetical protein [Haliscomenobacter sp.]